MKKIFSKLTAVLLILTFAFTGVISAADEGDPAEGLGQVSEDSGASEGDTSKDDTSKEDTTGGDSSKDDTTGGDSSKEDTTGGDSSKDDTTGGDSSKDDTTDGDTSKDDTTGGDTSKDDTTGGDSSKDDTTGGDTSKEEQKKTEPDDVTYKTKADDYVTFSAKDFTDQFKEITGKDFYYLTVTTLPSSSYGVLYYDYDGKDEAKVKTTSRIYKDMLGKISFAAAKKGNVSIPYKMYSSDKSSVLSGTIKITVSEGDTASVSTITYTVSDDYVRFKAADFKSACSNALDKTLSYVKFTLPSSSSGLLYFDYNGDDEAKVSASKKYYSSGTPSLSKVYFVPKSNVSGTVSISYTGFTEDGKSYTGMVKVKLSSSAPDTDTSPIKYTVKNNSKVSLRAKDFAKICDAETDSDLIKIAFDSLPSSSKGAFYLGYKSSSNYEEKVYADEEYYYDEDPEISDITFVPKSSYIGTVTVTYKGYYTKTKYYTGSVQIKVTDADDDEDEDEDEDEIAVISISADENEPKKLNASTISAAYKKATGKTLSYIKLSKPSSSYGTLYYDYEGDDEEKVSSSDKYYLSKTPYIKNITFVPEEDFTGIVTLSYTAYGTSATGIPGTIKIKYQKGSGNDPSGSADVSLGVVKNKNLSFTVSPFNVACLSVTDASIRSVKFGLVNASYGALYYAYGTENQKEVTPSMIFYTSTSPQITDVTFVPAKGYKGNISIAYTGTSTKGDTFTGMIRLTVASYKKLFSDVTDDKWYYDTVNTVCDADLMIGNSDTTFNPEGTMTLAEAVTMGARLYNSITGNQKSFTASADGNWYDVYVDYAVKNGIIREGDFSDFTKIATRGEMAYIFYHSVTDDYLSKINSWLVPDVSSDDLYGSEIYGLYNAGILTGSDDKGTFNAKNGITRAEAAAILGRTGKIIDRIKK